MTSLIHSSYIERMNRFFYSPAYFFLIGGLTVVSNIFGAELLAYTCFILIGLYLCLLGPDLLPLMPIAVCCYIAPSRKNNPGLHTDTIFSASGGGIYLIILAALLLAALIYRLIRDPEFGGKKFFTCKRRFLPGILLLGGSYLLSGLGSGQWAVVGWQNLLFSSIQFLSIFALYYLFTGAVNWDDAPKAYLAWTGVCVGYVLIAQLVNIYLRYPIIQNGVILREFIFTGWGHYNNIGALLAMMIPFSFFLTGKGKYSGIFYLTGILFLMGVLFTCSRGSILCGIVTYAISYTISLLNSRRARANLAIHVFTILLFLGVFFCFRTELLLLFQSLIDRGFDPAERITGYIAGWKQFLKFPIFGGTFYPVDFPLYSWSTSQSFVAFFPPRWHNTLLQMLASCGIVGLLAYGYHRWQTMLLFFRRPSGKKMFVFAYVFTLLVTSMIDCHFFNVGPTLLYAMALAFTEKKLDT